MFGPTTNLAILNRRALCEPPDADAAVSNFVVGVHPNTRRQYVAGVYLGGVLRVFFAGGEGALEAHLPDMEDQTAMEIVSLSFTESEEVVLVFAVGEFFKGLLSCSASGSGSALNSVGSMAGGVSAASWSPDGEILAVATSGSPGLLILMTRDLEVVSEQAVQADSLGSEEMISIGWGKKETQFHGSAGKQAALTRPEIRQELVHESDNREARITWRQDGQFFAVGSVDSGIGADTEHRRVRVYSRSGELRCTSEPVEGLEGPLAWRPNGSLLAACQFLRAQNRRQVSFFERNGLRHGEFVLPSDSFGPVKDVCWSADSNILAVLFAEPKKRAELWCCSNAHWYRKLVLPIPVQNLAFDTEDSSLLLVLDSLQRLHVLKLSWEQHVSDSTVFIADGNKINITPLSRCNIPPPMSLLHVDMAGTPLALTAKHLNLNTVLCVGCTNDGWLQSFRVSVAASRAECHVEALESVRLSVIPIQMQMLGDGLLLMDISGCVYWRAKGAEPILVAEGGHRVLREGWAMLADGTLQRFIPDALKFEWKGHFENCCEQVDVLAKTADVEPTVLGLSDSGKLFVNDRMLMSQVTSFSWCDDFVLVTTSSTNELVFFPRSQPLDAWFKQASLAVSNEEARRRIERGTLLVCAVPETASVVLQQARGNLETVSPRALVLAMIRTQLQSLDFGSAYRNARRHRIDLNFLHDFDSELFLLQAAKFVADLGGTEHVNLFLTALRDEDVTLTKYSGFGEQMAGPRKDGVAVDKVNRVSEAILQVLLAEPHRHVDSIMTVWVVQSPPQHEKALDCIVELAKSARPELLEKSLKYLFCLVQPERLYDAALGMHNLELALSIARRSPTQDPKDYMPFLERLAGLEELERRFTIDDHLQRHALALAHLSRQPDFDRFLAYMRRHELYSVALVLTADAAEQSRAAVYLQFAEFKEPTDASLAVKLYKRAGASERALSLAATSGAWLDVLELLPMTETSMQRAAVELTLKALSSADAVQFAGRLPFDQGLIASAEFVDLALAAGCWDLAVHRVPESRAKVALAVEAQCQRLLDDLSALSAEFGDKTSRMLRVQREFLEDPNRVFMKAIMKAAGGAELGDETLSELSFKTATTVRSMLSGMSSSSSKRSARKKQRLRDKPGSPQEREFLLGSLRMVLERIGRMESEVRSLLLAALSYSPDPRMDKARCVSREFGGLVADAKRFVADFGHLRLPAVAYFNEKGEAVGQDGQVMTSPRLDPLDAKFDLAADFGTRFAIGAFP